MDQSCLGTPRTLNSEITVTIDEDVDIVEPAEKITASDDQANDELELTVQEASVISSRGGGRRVWRARFEQQVHTASGCVLECRGDWQNVR